jgi:hypothetical protein
MAEYRWQMAFVQQEPVLYDGTRADLESRPSARGGLLVGEEPCKRRLARRESTDESGRRWKEGETGSNLYFGREYQRADTKFSKSIKRWKPSF